MVIKVKTFKHYMRFIKDGQWWRIKFPIKKNGERIYDGEFQHRCFAESPNMFVKYHELTWIRCRRSEMSRIVTCDNCGAEVPEEVLADASMLGVQPEEKSSISESMEKYLKEYSEKQFKDSWVRNPEPQRYHQIWTSDRTDMGNTWINQDTSTTGPKIYKNPSNPSVTRYVYDNTVKITNDTS